MPATQYTTPEIGRDTAGDDLAGGEPVLIRETADLVPEEDHRFGKREVVVTQTRVAVFDGAGVQLLSVPMDAIASARTEPLVGGARLELSLKAGGVLPVAEFTAAVAGRFSEMARGIEQLAKGEDLAVKLARERTHCANCGRLLPEKDGKCPACVKRMAVFGRILGYLAPYKAATFWVTTSSLLTSAVATFAQLWMTRGLTDRVLNHHPQPLSLAEGKAPLLFYLGALAAALVVNIGLGFLKNYHGAYLAANIAKDLRANTYAALGRLQINFYDKKQIGAIISRVTQDTERIWRFLADGVPYLLVGSLTIVGGLASGLLLSWKLALAILLPVPAVALVGSLIWKPMAARQYKEGQKWARLHTHLNESLTGIRVVKAFVQEAGELGKFTSRNNELAGAAVTVDRYWHRAEAVVNFFVNCAPLINWGFGGYLVLKGELSFGTLMAMQILLWQVYGPLAWFGQVNQWFSRAMAGAESVFEVIDAVPESYDGAAGGEPPSPARPILGAVQFDKVRFGYDKSNPVLKGIELDIKAGEMIGLVGKSGAGKSTTMNLLCRFYEADSGALRIDGVDIRHIPLGELRRHIGIVLQEPFLFAGTVAENIAYGKPGATFDEIVAAAKAACAHDFIVSKPDGYDSPVGEKGAKLSGGERQRVSIARAILHNPRILILDEATSSVDVETEKNIQKAIGNLVRGRTTFAIAHRLSTLRHADRLVVLDKGKIAEVGTHAELMALKGEFYKLVETQAQTSKAISDTVAL